MRIRNITIRIIIKKQIKRRSNLRLMKIAMIGHKRIPSREGGVEIVVEELATRLAKKGYEVDVYNRKGNHVADNTKKTEKLKEYKGVKINTIFTINKKGLDALLYSFLASVKAVLGRYDCIHYHAERKLCNAMDSKIVSKKSGCYDSWLRLATSQMGWFCNKVYQIWRENGC